MSWWSRQVDLVPSYDKNEPPHVAQCREASAYFVHEGYAMWHVVVMTAWLVAELNWKFKEHGHHTTGGQTGWGPVIPHWK